MDSQSILQQFKEKVSDEITLEEKGRNKFLVKTPFIFEDGDHLIIILKYDVVRKSWILTDEANTFMHMSYFMNNKDIEAGTRAEIISTAQKMFGVIEEDGELLTIIEDDTFGNALYDFVQCLLKITDITYTERQKIVTMFFEDFRKSMKGISKMYKLEAEFDYTIPEDKNKEYPITCYIATKRMPTLIFAINNDDRCRDSTIFIYALKDKFKKTFHSVGVFDDWEGINKKVFARFLNVSEKTITSLEEADELKEYIARINTD